MLTTFISPSIQSMRAGSGLDSSLISGSVGVGCGGDSDGGGGAGESHQWVPLYCLAAGEMKEMMIPQTSLQTVQSTSAPSTTGSIHELVIHNSNILLHDKRTCNGIINVVIK